MKDECEKTLHRVYLYLDREVLTEQERVEIRAHLEACRPCLERYGLDELIAALVGRLRNSQRCPADVRARITALFE
jgi:mycothiol system anti-sigma-R factor